MMCLGFEPGTAGLCPPPHIKGHLNNKTFIRSFLFNLIYTIFDPISSSWFLLSKILYILQNFLSIRWYSNIKLVLELDLFQPKYFFAFFLPLICYSMRSKYIFCWGSNRGWFLVMCLRSTPNLNHAAIGKVTPLIYGSFHLKQDIFSYIPVSVTRCWIESSPIFSKQCPQVATAVLL